MNDQQLSSPASGAPIGEGIVSWGDYAIGYVGVEEEVYSSPQPMNAEFSLWRDMAEEPSKYGDDIGDWLVLDDELRAGPGRWRVDAYWRKEQQAVDWANLQHLLDMAWYRFLTRKERFVVRIQALWRGYSVRQRIPWRDCCMCLAHHISSIETEVGFMCRECAQDGPHSDLIGMDDPWDWFRAEALTMVGWQEALLLEGEGVFD